MQIFAKNAPRLQEIPLKMRCKLRIRTSCFRIRPTLLRKNNFQGENIELYVGLQARVVAIKFHTCLVDARSVKTVKLVAYPINIDHLTIQLLFLHY